MKNKLDPSGYFLFLSILAEGKAKGYGFEEARAVYAKRTGGEECPFYEKAPTPILYVDFETRSECDIKETGSAVYAEHPSTEIMCLSFAFGDGDAQLWLPGSPCPASISAHIAAGGRLEAHNAEFEQNIWHYICVRRLGWPKVHVDKWSDSMAACAAMAIPQSLGGATAALNAGEEKNSEGHKLMLKLCKPRKATKTSSAKWHEDPADLAKLYEYCRQDVVAERGLGKLVPALSEAESNVWRVHNRINRRGIHADRSGVKCILEMLGRAAAYLGEQVVKATGGALTGDDLASQAKVRPWCLSRGVELADYTKAEVARVLEDPSIPEDVAVVLRARQATGRTSTGKLPTILANMNADDRIRGTLAYHGAATGRWSGRGIQPQNFPREGLEDFDAALEDMAALPIAAFIEKRGDPFALAVKCLRGCLNAATGHMLAAADYNAIEARVALWLAGDPGVAIFLDPKRSIYSEMAAKIFGVPVSSITKLSRERFVGKETVLAGVFGQGGVGFHAKCLEKKIEITLEVAHQSIAAFRAQFPQVPRGWREVEEAALQAIMQPGKVFAALRLKYKMIGEHLYCRLPSGRRICYPFARVQEKMTPWGEMRNAVFYMGIHPKTHQWTLLDTYGACLFQNAVQGIARDCMADALVRMEDAGWRPVLTVHDEALAEVPESRGDCHKELEAFMCQLPAWAQGLPVAAEGWYGPRFRK